MPVRNLPEPAMRIQRHVSVILIVAIGGAMALAMAVAMLFGDLERVARRTAEAADRHERVASLLADGRILQVTIHTLTTRSAEEKFVVAQWAIGESLSELSRVRREAGSGERGIIDDAIATLQRCRSLAASRPAEVRDPDDLERLRESAGMYASHLQQLEAIVGERARAQASGLTLRRRIAVGALALCCIAYLAVIERVRHWTGRHLVDPLERLAEAAAGSLEGGGKATVELGGTSNEELRTLAGVLAALVDAHGEQVRARTAQVERQKERLEREVRVRRRAEEQLRFTAFRDRLTGLCSRDLLTDRVQGCLERAQRRDGYRFAVLFVDIDRFEEVTKGMGDLYGDRLLVAIAERLAECLHSADTLSRVETESLARIGGDEFVILLDGIKARGDASAVAERLQESLAEPFRIGDSELSMTASIGIAFNEPGADKPEGLLRNADTAMYYAKAAGRARIEVFNRRMHTAVTARQQLYNELRLAIENDEFAVVYQPIVCLKTGRLAGFEALARWDDPRRGQISPVEFIADAEETGLIVQLGHRMLDRACRQIAEWRRQSGAADLSVSVNVSKRQVVEPGFRDQVKQIVSATGIEGSVLNLEITESTVMENPDAIAEVLRQLKTLGVEIHMDDFGTGYSSLIYLHRFPLDVIKIDRAFMSTLSTDNDYAEVVHTVVAMAHALNLRVTVEGVETEDQLAQLLALECNYAQGYYFSEPLDAASAGRLITAEPRWLQSAA